VFLPGRSKGIPHAHNVFLHALADQGLVTLLLMVIALAVTLQRLLIGLVGDAGPLCFTGLGCALFILASSLVESTLLKTSLQQVVSGYLLAIAWVVSPAPTQENSHTISS
jgi:O-antigen ligase